MSQQLAEGEIVDAEYSTTQDPNIVSTGMMQVRGTHTTAMAVQRPRRLGEVKRRVEEEAALAGERFYYGWGAGQNRIEGPSIKLANTVARCYGNCAVDLLPIQDLPDSWVFTAVFIDLETGFTLPRQFRQAKNHVVHGKHDEARKADMRFQIGQSKAIRNVILNAVPTGLIDAAMDAAKAGVRAKIESFIDKVEKSEGKGKGLPKAIDAMLASLKKQGIDEARVLARLEIADKKGINVDHLVRLRGDLASLEDGEARPEELFPPVAAEGAKGADALKAKLDKAKGAGNEPKPEADVATPPKDGELFDAKKSNTDAIKG